MKKICSVPDLVTAGHYRNLLENHGIPCLLRNELLGGAVGELPPQEVWPELWVQDDRDQDLAMRIIEEDRQQPDARFSAWTCPACGEHIDAQFGQCWHCGAEAPDSP